MPIRSFSIIAQIQPYRKARIIRAQHGRQRNCHPRQEYFRDDMGREMSRKYLCSRQQLCWRVDLVEWERVRRLG